MKFLLRQDLRARGIPYCNKHLLHLEATKRFPQRVRLGGGKTVAWIEGEIDAYQSKLAAARNAPQAAA